MTGGADPAGADPMDSAALLTQPWQDRWIDRPPGFRSFEAAFPLGRGRAVFERAAEEALTWQVKTRSGFDIAVEDAECAGDADSARGGGQACVVDSVPILPRVRVGQEPTIHVRLGPFRLPEPARIVAVVDEQSRCGFTYETQPGHPVTGEESFLVVHGPDDRVHLLLRSASAPGAGLWRFADPLVRIAQIVYRRRYARALRVGHQEASLIQYLREDDARRMKAADELAAEAHALGLN